MKRILILGLVLFPHISNAQNAKKQVRECYLGYRPMGADGLAPAPYVRLSLYADNSATIYSVKDSKKQENNTHYLATEQEVYLQSDKSRVDLYNATYANGVKTLWCSRTADDVKFILTNTATCLAQKF